MVNDSYGIFYWQLPPGLSHHLSLLCHSTLNSPIVLAFFVRHWTLTAWLCMSCPKWPVGLAWRIPYLKSTMQQKSFYWGYLSGIKWQGMPDIHVWGLVYVCALFIVCVFCVHCLCVLCLLCVFIVHRFSFIIYVLHCCVLPVITQACFTKRGIT